MDIEKIINYLLLIDGIIPDYSGGRRLGLSDEEIETLPLRAINQVIELLESIHL